jgi:large subunit ribosomal protein L3
MAIGLIGRKQGMTRIFTDEGQSIPVSVVEVCDNRVTQVKTQDKDGYQAIQITYGSRKASHINKAQAGLFTKAGVEAGEDPVEFRLEDGEPCNFEVGSKLGLDIFTDGQSVDVTGISKGKGFAGVIKRYHFSMQDATHGNSLSHRAPGSIGQNQSPGRVFKGKKMAGQLGNKKITVQSLQLVKVDAERSLLLIKGAIPGATGSDVIVRPAVKAKA